MRIKDRSPTSGNPRTRPHSRPKRHASPALTTSHPARPAGCDHRRLRLSPFELRGGEVVRHQRRPPSTKTRGLALPWAAGSRTSGSGKNVGALPVNRPAMLGQNVGHASDSMKNIDGESGTFDGSGPRMGAAVSHGLHRGAASMSCTWRPDARAQRPKGLRAATPNVNCFVALSQFEWLRDGAERSGRTKYRQGNTLGASPSATGGRREGRTAVFSPVLSLADSKRRTSCSQLGQR